MARAVVTSNGGNAFRAVARDLRLAAGPDRRGIRSNLRRNIVASTRPMEAAIKRNAFNIPSSGRDSRGLRTELMRATRTQVGLGSRMPRVRLLTDGKRMGGARGSLPQYMEGERKWRHPVFAYPGVHGDRSVPWVTEQSHPYFAPAVRDHLAEVSRGVTAAVETTALFLARG